MMRRRLLWHPGAALGDPCCEDRSEPEHAARFVRSLFVRVGASAGRLVRYWVASTPNAVPALRRVCVPGILDGCPTQLIPRSGPWRNAIWRPNQTAERLRRFRPCYRRSLTVEVPKYGGSIYEKSSGPASAKVSSQFPALVSVRPLSNSDAPRMAVRILLGRIPKRRLSTDYVNLPLALKRIAFFTHRHDKYSKSTGSAQISA